MTLSMLLEQKCQYEKFWPDWARFGPDSGHKVIFKARTERDKARQPFCLVCETERDICLVSLSPIIWREWARKMLTEFTSLRLCTETFVRPHYRCFSERYQNLLTLISTVTFVRPYYRPYYILYGMRNLSYKCITLVYSYSSITVLKK